MMCCLKRTKPPKKRTFYLENGTIIQAPSFSEAVKGLYSTVTQNTTFTYLRDEMWLVSFHPDLCVVAESPSRFRAGMVAEWVLHLDRRKPKIMSEPKVQQLERVLAEAQLHLTETPEVLQHPEPEPSVQLGVWRRTGTS
jgi:hypothetical protein